MNNKIKIMAPGKINLTLDVLGIREDNYHEVKMIMQTVSLYDTVTIKGKKTNNTNKITINCNYPDVPNNFNNIAYKAAEAFLNYNKINNYNLKIEISKKIPTKAGLAGGSTNAAAVIYGLNIIYNTNLKENILYEIGSKIGADVPFCITGGTQLATGIGTTLTKLKNIPKSFIVLCMPNTSVSTAEAYKQVDSNKNKTIIYTDKALKALENNNYTDFYNNFNNDFEKALKIKEVDYIKKVFKNNNGQAASMTGSGPTVFGFFENEEDACNSKKILQKEYTNVFICEPVNHGVKLK